MTIEKHFDVPFVAALALREKQIQQNYRPIVAIHKWFARRPGTLFRGLVLAEFCERPLAESFYQAHDLEGLKVADPFMGGGTPLVEANRVGCDVVGYDINPMAYWIVRQAIEHLDLAAYRASADRLIRHLESEIGELYRTTCLQCGSGSAAVKYFLWVKTQECPTCGKRFDMFPGYLLARAVRHPRQVFVCASCGALREAPDSKDPGPCTACGEEVRRAGAASRGKCSCPHCGAPSTYPRPEHGAPEHRMFAIEYHCSACRPAHQGRFFKAPDPEDLGRYEAAAARWLSTKPRFMPNDKIPSGDETERLHRWGYRHYREMFNARQLLGLELSCRAVEREPDARVRSALATNLSDLLRYQNMLCRYDTMALKSLDIFSVHGFPVGLIQCESNLLGILSNAGTNVGSGGWGNIVSKFAKAKEYCDAPFEVKPNGSSSARLAIAGEWIGDIGPNGGNGRRRDVDLHCESATSASLEPDSLDAVLTDPPYFGNVQYAELMDFCYVWLRKLVGEDLPEFHEQSTRSPDELTGNATMARGLDHFTAGLSEVFGRMAIALKAGRPFAFTYHNNDIAAYYPIAVALLDAGLVCTASLPCPAEMGASIHINGTGSSVVDTVFVCRSTGTIPQRLLNNTVDGLVDLVRRDLRGTEAAGLRPTAGDIRCLVYGHLVRLAVWQLRGEWSAGRPVAERIADVASEIARLNGPHVIAAVSGTNPTAAATSGQGALRLEESREAYGEPEVSF